MLHGISKSIRIADCCNSITECFDYRNPEKKTIMKNQKGLNNLVFICPFHMEKEQLKKFARIQYPWI